MAFTEEEKVLRERERQRVGNMTADQIERRNARQRVANLPADRVARRREYGRQYKLNSEQRLRKRQRGLGRWAATLLSGATKNSRRRGHGEPTISVEWIENELKAQPLCPYTGIRLVPPNEDKNGGRRCPWAPSLDRIDNDAGYTPENTKLTSWFWNCFRGQVPIEEALSNLKIAAACILGAEVSVDVDIT